MQRKTVGDREILETYTNSASKNTSETDIFPHGPKSLLTSVIWTVKVLNGARGDVVVKALRYKPADRGFDSRWCHWNFSVM